MADIPRLAPGKTGFARLITALGRKDPRLNEMAAEILCRLGKQAVPMLVEEAIAKRKRPDHCVSILDVVQRIGEPLDEEFFVVMLMLRYPVERVRMKAAEVIAALSPAGRAGGGPSEAEVAVVLAFMGGSELEPT